MPFSARQAVERHGAFEHGIDEGIHIIAAGGPIQDGGHHGLGDLGLRVVGMDLVRVAKGIA